MKMDIENYWVSIGILKEVRHLFHVNMLYVLLYSTDIQEEGEMGISYYWNSQSLLKEMMWLLRVMLLRTCDDSTKSVHYIQIPQLQKVKTPKLQKPKLLPIHFPQSYP